MDVRVALVGCGHWGRNLARNLLELGVLEAVCDTDPAASTVVSDAGVRTTADVADIWSDPRIDAVVLATPAATHAALGMDAIASGKDVLVEKPLALAVADGAELVDAAERADRILMVGHILEYHPAVDALRSLVAEDELGEIRYLYSNRVNLGRVRTEENITWSFAPHDLSVMMGLVGRPPVTVASWGGSYLQEGIADVTVTALDFGEGVRGHVFVSWLHPFKEQRLVVVGERRMAVFAGTDAEPLVLYDKGVEMRDGIPVLRGAPDRTVTLADAEPMRRELEHFLECVVSRQRPRTDGRNGLQVLRALQAAQSSLEGGGLPVRFEEVGR